MSFELFLATRYLFARRKGFFMWTTTLISVGGIFLGVATLIVTLAVMTGFREDIRARILGIQPHIVMVGDGKTLKYPDPELSRKVTVVSEVEASSPFIIGQVVVRKGPNAAACTMKGVLPELEAKVTEAPAKIKEGHWGNLKRNSANPGIILGKELAKTINASLGDKVVVFAPGTDGTELLGFLPRTNVFTVCGIADTGLYEYDLTLAYANLPFVQRLLGVKDTVSGYGIKVRNFEHTERVVRRLQHIAGEYVWVRSWLSLNRNLFSALKLEKIVMTTLLALITLVAAFSIVGNLVMAITQKVREIGIMRAMGATSNSIRRIFLYKGILLGFIGTGLGTLTGVTLSTILSRTKLITLPADVYYVDTLPVKLSLNDVAIVAGIAMVIVLAASLYPSIRAAKLDPCEALRMG